MVPVEISGRHFHATEEDYRLLFGKSEPKPIHYLSQKGQFASDKIAQVSVDKKKVFNTRFLGPFRDHTQVEVTRSDAYGMGIEPPIMECSCNDNGAKVIITGPSGSIVRPAAIVSYRHLHLSPKKAEKLKIKDGDKVAVRIPGERALTLENILVRVDESFTFDVHIDTDEANAAGISKTTEGELIIG